jgi:hypothetical protein
MDFTFEGRLRQRLSNWGYELRKLRIDSFGEPVYECIDTADDSFSWPKSKGGTRGATLREVETWLDWLNRQSSKDPIEWKYPDPSDPEPVPGRNDQTTELAGQEAPQLDDFEKMVRVALKMYATIHSSTKDSWPRRSKQLDQLWEELQELKRRTTPAQRARWDRWVREKGWRQRLAAIY